MSRIVRAMSSIRAASRGVQPMSAARLWEIDALRGVAVVLMVFFHLMWDLAYVGLSSVDVFARPWQIFARSIGTLFILLMGLSLQLVATRLADAKVLRRYVLRRGGLIFGLGMLISLGTYLLLGAEYVRFGILHLLGAGLVLAAPFAFAPFGVTVGVGMLLIVIGAWFNALAVPFPWLIWLGLPQLGVGMVDYYPLLPWAGVALLGVALGQAWYPQGRRRFRLPNLAEVPVVHGLGWLGRHSLGIYLLHQPLILGVLVGWQWLSRL
jgi:uncharacterized membrane protein